MNENPSSTNSLNAWMDDPGTVDMVRQMQEDFAWALEHHRELEQQYPGESVVVWQKQVIAHGSDAEELLDMLETQGYAERELVVLGNSCFAVRWR